MKKMKRFIAAVLTIIIIISIMPLSVIAAASPVPSGSGTPDDPYQIGTAEQLKWFANAVNNVEDKTATGRFNALLIDDIILNNEEINADTIGVTEWTPINDYRDVFDGNNHTISGVMIRDTGGKYAGFFGTVYGKPDSKVNLDYGTIKNLKITNSYIQGEQAGTIIAHSYGANILNCYSEATVYSGTAESYSYAGGIVGYADNYYTNKSEKKGTRIERCFNKGKVTAMKYSGGIAGWSQGGVNYSIYKYSTRTVGNYTFTDIDGYTVIDEHRDMTVVINCGNVGEITSRKASYYEGGIIGDCYRSSDNSSVSTYIENCYTLSSTISSGLFAGLDDSWGGYKNNYPTSLHGDSDFQSGEITYLLNNQKTGGEIWYQNIDLGNIDPYPVLDDTHYKIYYNTSTDTYTNKCNVVDGFTENNIYYSIDVNNGLLELEGNGNTDVYTEDNRSPWYTSRNYIFEVKIYGDVISDKSVFDGMKQLEKIYVDRDSVADDLSLYPNGIRIAYNGEVETSTETSTQTTSTETTTQTTTETTTQSTTTTTETTTEVTTKLTTIASTTTETTTQPTTATTEATTEPTTTVSTTTATTTTETTTQPTTATTETTTKPTTTVSTTAVTTTTETATEATTDDYEAYGQRILYFNVDNISFSSGNYLLPSEIEGFSICGNGEIKKNGTKSTDVVKSIGIDSLNTLKFDAKADDEIVIAFWSYIMYDKLGVVDVNSGETICEAPITSKSVKKLYCKIPKDGEYYIRPTTFCTDPIRIVEISLLRLGSNITQATTETTTEVTTQSTTASTIQSTTQTTTQTTTEPTSEVTTENTTHMAVPTIAYVGSDTILASDVLASHPNGIGGNGTADDPEEIYIGAGVYVVNGGSAFQQKDKYLYSGGKTFDVEFQIGKGNENIPLNATSVKLPIEKGLKFDVGGSGFAKIYAGIGSSGVEEMQLLVADSTGKIINKITVDNIGASEIFFPSAGVYYVFNPAKQASWNLAAIDIGIDGTVNEYVFGDADGDNVVTASDAAFVLQKTLVSTFELPIEKKTNEWLKYADVDCDSYITASDAAFILQKTLVSTFELPAEQNA